MQAMQAAYTLLIFLLFLFLAVSNRGTARSEPAGDPLGERFLCSDVPTRKLCLPTLLSGCRMTLKLGSGIPSEPEERVLQWSDLLGCSVRHALPCKTRLQEARRKGSSQTIRRLANILLEEWDLPTNDSRLQTPRLVWAPTPSIEEVKHLLPREVDWSIIIATGIVQPNG
jgi:hypothetical protein